MLPQVDQQLTTPYGVAMFAPPFTSMREDIGRVTQKYPGSAENGAVYNHASVFYIYSLYAIQEKDRAYKFLRQMLPGPDEADYLRRGQLPVYIPNYYRGAWHLHPRTAGRSSHLFNTGTISWVYRCFVEGLFGLRGDPEGLNIQPQLPSEWQEAKIERIFRGATFVIDVRRGDVKEVTVKQDGKLLPRPHVSGIQKGVTYHLEVLLPH